MGNSIMPRRRLKQKGIVAFLCPAIKGFIEHRRSLVNRKFAQFASAYSEQKHSPRISRTDVL